MSPPFLNNLLPVVGPKAKLVGNGRCRITSRVSTYMLSKDFEVLFPAKSTARTVIVYNPVTNESAAPLGLIAAEDNAATAPIVTFADVWSGPSPGSVRFTLSNIPFLRRLHAISHLPLQS